MAPKVIVSARNAVSAKNISPVFPASRNAAPIVAQLSFAKVRNTTSKFRKNEVKNNSVHFQLLTLSYRIRDFFRPRISILQEIGIKAGARMLDFGCGPGSYIEPLAKLVSPKGQIYALALDINPLAIRSVRQLAQKKSLIHKR